jgi:hypothetical protein
MTYSWYPEKRYAKSIGSCRYEHRSIFFPSLFEYLRIVSWEMISRIFFNINSFSNLCSVAGGKFAFLLETCCTLDSRHVVKHGKMASFHYHSRDIPMPA